MADSGNDRTPLFCSPDSLERDRWPQQDRVPKHRRRQPGLPAYWPERCRHRYLSWPPRQW